MVGLDIGTMNIVSARQTDDKVVTKRIRDAFIDVPKSAKKMLKLSKTSYIEHDDELLIIGDDALKFAHVFGREIRRPLQKGLISPDELIGAEVIATIIKQVLGTPQVEGEICVYSVPASPIDSDKDVIYHKRLFEQMIDNMGYTAISSNEAMAIIFSEAGRCDFTGLSISFGSGMTNIALAMKTIECHTFSVARGGDWIDNGAASSCGTTKSKMCAIKENGIDLLNPEGREQQAISFYYKELIEYLLKHLLRQLKVNQKNMVFDDAIPIFISGGTSKPKNFKALFENMFKKFKKRFPFHVEGIYHADQPLNSVAEGLLVQAIQEEE